MKLDAKKLPVITTLIITLVMIITLFVVRAGVADNGNLRYVLEDIGMYDYQSASGSGYYADGFGVSSKTLGTGTGGLVYGIIKLAFPVDSVMFVWIPAIVYLAVFVAGIYLFLKSMIGENKTVNILMCILAAIIVADAGYVAFFNTPYTEGAFIAYLVLFCGSFAACAKTGKVRYLILSGIAGILFGATGIYASLTGILLAFVLLGFMKTEDIKKRVIAVLMAVLVFAASVYGFTIDKSGDGMKYNRIFYGVLSVSENAEQSLGDMGIDKEFAQYANTASFDEKAQNFIASQDFAKVRDKADTFSVLKYYFTHTDDFSKALKACVNNSTMIKSSYLGDYPASSGKASQQSSFWTIYSTLKAKLMPASMVFILVFALAVLVLSLSYKGKHKDKQGTAQMVYLLIALALGAVLTLPLAVVQNGLSLIDFNMRSYNFLFDLSLFGGVTGGVNMMLSRQQELRDKYGVNQ
ncbi:MAG: hypothetical protein J6A69_05315 [Clostridia bacterium]|nr:hypothetical protein [Clostridia bacterium]